MNHRYLFAFIDADELEKDVDPEDVYGTPEVSDREEEDPFEEGEDEKRPAPEKENPKMTL